MTFKDYADDIWFALAVLDPIGITGTGIGAVDAFSKLSYNVPAMAYGNDAMLIGSGLGFLAFGAIIHKGYHDSRKEKMTD